MSDASNVVVTGGAGYIGSHVCKLLAREGFTPVTLDNLSRGHRSAVKWGPLVVGDLTDSWVVLDTIARYRPLAVMHFAALAYVGESVSDPEHYYHNNIVGSLSVMRACKHYDVRNFVFSSTCATYGIPNAVPISETHPLAPVNPYGNTKLAVERMLADFGLAYGLRSVSLRYFNAAGADPEGEIGERHDPETHAMPLAILAALRKRASFSIFGTDYPTPDGTAVRDYIHVSDLATGHVLALRYLLDGGEETALNLGTGVGHSLRELVASAERVCKGPIQVIESARRPGDPPALVADAKCAQRVLGWRPEFTELDEIVSTAARWHERFD